MSFAIIHLTDIHIVASANDNIILERKQQLYEAYCSILCPKDTAIVIISGDIAYSGKSQEYENAFELIDYLQQNLKTYLTSDVKILMVPGNHDCDFEKSTSLRERLLSTFDTSLRIDQETLQVVTSVQECFFEFSELFTKFSSEIFNMYSTDYNGKKILFQMINTAWMSQEKEQAGKLILPINAFKRSKTEEYDCVCTVMHHPYNWLHPDNCADFLEFIRQTTDLLLIGHEHRKDAFTSSSENWLMSEFRGKELQNETHEDSAFSIYQFDNEFQNLTTYDFSWNNTLYSRITERCDIFIRNTLTSSLMLTPSKKYISEYIDDPGMIIVHESAENVRLPEIYCWPILEHIEVQDSVAIINKKITEDIPSQLLTSPISIVVGDSLSGKSSMVKMLFKDYIQNKKCCIILKGEDLNTIVEGNLRQRIESIFSCEYSEHNIEKYRQLPREKRILIIDDFHNIPYLDERRSKVLSLLIKFASNIIIFMDNEVEGRMICSKLAILSDSDINYYRICSFGNTKRYEFIRKWYCLQNEYANGDENIEAKISNTFDRINSLLGKSNGFIPAAPIYLINLLQNIDSVTPASFSGSHMGFFMNL